MANYGTCGCNFDTKTRWAGTYQGLRCGVILGSEQTSTLVTVNQTWVLACVAPGVYSVTINGEYRGQGIAYIDANCVPTLQIINIDGQSFVKTAVKVDRKRRVRKFLSPSTRGDLEVVPPLRETALAVLKRVSNRC